MKQYITLLTLYTFLSINTNAQALKQKQLDYLSDHNISLIDSTILYRDVLKKNGKVKMLIIFTNYCAGTPHVFKSMADYKEQYGNRMEFILCSSASKRDVDGLAKVLSTYKSSEQVYFIDPAQYKEYRFDDRKKGFQFRNHICHPVRKMR